MLFNFEVSVPCLDFVISIKYFLNIIYVAMNIWYQEVTLQLVCASNTFEIISIFVINRWTSEKLGCEL